MDLDVVTGGASRPNRALCLIQTGSLIVIIVIVYHHSVSPIFACSVEGTIWIQSSHLHFDLLSSCYHCRLCPECRVSRFDS